MNRCTAILAALLSFCASADSKQTELGCGTHAERWREDLHKHYGNARYRESRARFAARFAAADSPARELVLADKGNVAILSAADGVVARRNSFNLYGKTLRFTRSAAGLYRFDTADSAYDTDAAANGSLIAGLGDDDTREWELPFAFPFYAGSYRKVFINSDGNLTFIAGDPSSSDRSLGRLTAGKPRIAALFADLDPSRARDGVRVLADSGRFVVSWVEVPEYRDLGRGPIQTFQVKLTPDGAIEISYASITALDAVVGIAPGHLEGDSAVVSFLSGSSRDYSAAVAERFSASEEIDIFTAAQKFYLNHEDAYDYLVLYNTVGIEAASGAVAYEVTVRNDRSGYGDQKVDLGPETGSRHRLQAILNLGPLDQYPKDPKASVPARLTSGDTALTVLGHEAGHLFLAYASVRDEEGSSAQPMLGRQSAHWSFLFNSEASLLEGNRIQDNGPNANPRFLTTATVEGYSPLDQYLMGLRPKEEVPDTFLVRRATVAANRSPQVGVTFSGERQNVTVDDIIEAVGRRTPDHTVAQRRFRFAFVLITPEGQEPSAQQLEQIETYRREFEGFFNRASSGNAYAETTLLRSLRVSTHPAAGVMESGKSTATVSVESALASPLTILIRTPSGAVSAPASVTIPAGARQASFEIRGVRAGVDDLILEPAGGGYESSWSRVQVRPARDLKLALISGDNQPATAGRPLASPIEVRVTDVNELPYPGVALTAEPAAGGTVMPATTVTDANGIARFQWTPGQAAANTLRITAATGSSVVATALSRPSLYTNGVVNAASWTGAVAPGSIAAAFGANLTGAQVSVNGTAATVLYSGASQVNFVVPQGTPEGTARVTVRTSAGESAPVSGTVAAYAPGVFAALPVGTYLEIYATGMGLQPSAATVQVLLGGTPLNVLYSGAAPGFLGLNQVNAELPAGVRGAQPLVLIVNGIQSNEIRVAVP
ncbi:MAG TPA: hypothetical protein VFL57_04245 [Bryobacteraceae bacterium]|nr:hypothetical protein [Bryobacteraceae bacterium]